MIDKEKWIIRKGVCIDKDHLLLSFQSPFMDWLSHNGRPASCLISQLFWPTFYCLETIYLARVLLVSLQGFEMKIVEKKKFIIAICRSEWVSNYELGMGLV